MSRTDGECTIQGRIGYASQTPWIFNASLKENILFGRKLDQKWYDEVVTACNLDTDVSQLPSGDETMIGERGVNLSGGQKARVALARAVYGKPDILLADSPLAAVDSRTANVTFKYSCNTKQSKLIH